MRDLRVEASSKLASGIRLTPLSAGSWSELVSTTTSSGFFCLCVCVLSEYILHTGPDLLQHLVKPCVHLIFDSLYFHFLSVVCLVS